MRRVHRLLGQAFVEAGVVHVDDAAHQVAIGEVDEVEHAAAQECVGQLFLVVRRDDDDGALRCDDLVARFRMSADEDAFAALVARHGPAVLGVCRRVLADRHAADDAFQATFLTLARKAGGVRNPAAVGCWLHGVAFRVASKLKGRLARLPQVGDVT